MNFLKQPRILFGTMLIILGIGLVLMNIGMIEHIPLTRFWPMILILMGLGKLMQDGGRERWSGVWLLGLGIWFQLVTLRTFGLTYHNSWPVMLIVWGIYLSGQALARKSHMQMTQENGNGN